MVLGSLLQFQLTDKQYKSTDVVRPTCLSNVLRFWYRLVQAYRPKFGTRYVSTFNNVHTVLGG